MIRIASVMAVILVIAAAVGLYRFKENSVERADRIDALRVEISAQRDRINVLRAEWNYLNQPIRIQELAGRYLDLDRLEVGQIATIESLPMRPIDLDPYEGNRLGGFAGGDGRVVQ
jgi:hypothetical protein